MAGAGPMYRGEGRAGGLDRVIKKHGELTRTLEPRLRRMAERLGWRLEKSKLEDASAPGYGTFQLVHTETGETITGRAAGPVGRRLLDADGNYGLVLDRVQNILISRGGIDLWQHKLEPMSAEEEARYSQG